MIKNKTIIHLSNRFFSTQVIAPIVVGIILFIAVVAVISIIVTVKSTLPKSMQPSIYPLGRRLTFSTSQVYTAESIRAAMPMIFTTAVMIIITLW